MKYHHLLLVSLVVAAGCGKGSAKEAEAEPGPIAVKTAKAEAKDIRESFPVDGTFVPAQGDVAKLAPVQAGRLATVLVKEGDTVKAGQLLASIDIGVLSAQQSSAAAGAASASQTIGNWSQGGPCGLRKQPSDCKIGIGNRNSRAKQRSSPSPD